MIERERGREIRSNKRRKKREAKRGEWKRHRNPIDERKAWGGYDENSIQFS